MSAHTQVTNGSFTVLLPDGVHPTLVISDGDLDPITNDTATGPVVYWSNGTVTLGAVPGIC